MGGFGSGKWSDVCCRKQSVELCREINIKFLKDNGFLNANKTGNIRWNNSAGQELGSVIVESLLSDDNDKTPLVVLQYEVLSSGGTEKSFKYQVELTQTPCHYGGLRWWFVCPAVKDGIYCGDRVGKLYLPPAGEYFGCRKCYDLTYESCQKSHKYDRILDHIPENMDLSELNVNQVLRLACL